MVKRLINFPAVQDRIPKPAERFRELSAESSEIPMPENGTLAATRTRDPLLRRQLLYPTELRAH